ncbi:MAG: hypothetical protein POH28_08665 [Acidocella sp.]|nr:hypothetical protein [Acidocella sp.]
MGSQNTSSDLFSPADQDAEIGSWTYSLRKDVVTDEIYNVAYEPANDQNINGQTPTLRVSCDGRTLDIEVQWGDNLGSDRVTYRFDNHPAITETWSESDLNQPNQPTFVSLSKTSGKKPFLDLAASSHILLFRVRLLAGVPDDNTLYDDTVGFNLTDFEEAVGPVIQACQADSNKLNTTN